MVHRMARANSAFNGSGAAQTARCVINMDENRWLAPMRLITNYEVVSIPLKPSTLRTTKLRG